MWEIEKYDELKEWNNKVKIIFNIYYIYIAEIETFSKEPRKYLQHCWNP